jgi:hypothetical protein
VGFHSPRDTERLPLDAARAPRSSEHGDVRDASRGSFGRDQCRLALERRPAATVGPRPVGRPEEPSWYESGWFATAVVAMVALITFVGFVMLAPPPAEMPVRPGDAPLVQDNLDAP